MMYTLYASKRPVECLSDESPFYLAINHTGWTPTSVRWFKCNPMGEDRLSRCMKIMAQKVGLVGKYTNHSVCRTMCTQLLQAGVAPTLITQLSGHKKINSLSSYATINSMLCVLYSKAVTKLHLLIYLCDSLSLYLSHCQLCQLRLTRLHPLFMLRVHVVA